MAPVYSADLQGTAGKAAIFGELLRKPPSDVAVLADFHRRHGLGLAMYSAQNIDRLVTFFRVSPQSDRFFVLDLSPHPSQPSSFNENWLTAQCNTGCQRAAKCRRASLGLA